MVQVQLVNTYKPVSELDPKDDPTPENVDKLFGPENFTPKIEVIQKYDRVRKAAIVLAKEILTAAPDWEDKNKAILRVQDAAYATLQAIMDPEYSATFGKKPKSKLFTRKTDKEKERDRKEEKPPPYDETETLEVDGRNDDASTREARDLENNRDRQRGDQLREDQEQFYKQP